MSAGKLLVAGILYPGFELLDLFGPLEMYSMLGPEHVDIKLIAATVEPVGSAMGQAVGAGPRATPDYNFANAPQADIIVLPGGFGTLPELENNTILAFLQQQSADAQYTTSVCTGSLLLAKAGLLDGRRATTNKQFFALSAMVPSDTQWVEEARWVEDGKFFTSSGVSAGMDMSLALIAKLWGEDEAVAAADGAEYQWHRDAASDPFYDQLNNGARAFGLI
ncbi:DJ-1/PfpI family protein [Halioglobus maricola]|uniref:DJ-1/PfpI family protein n=1 Tax=Halioglobus maricola TaxID=2601894 RepID=A0A5P9NIE7_9GAMM|nr:DJ-1/PfpI family protein [Halioglobus maricola]QFU75597.1 DJ-1/PfpI family protein [Halioglobus maricola]